MDTGSVDMAKTMAEVFAKGDANKDEKLNKQEFINVSSYSILFEGNTKNTLSCLRILRFCCDFL